MNRISRSHDAGVNGWREVWHARRADAAMLALFAAFFVAFFSWVFFTGKLLVGGDAFVYSYPLRAAAWDAIRHGHLPLWTPTIFSGYPLLSISQLAVGYPLTWGYAFLPGGYAEEVFVLAPFLLAPAFTYFYARQIARTRLAALVAALTFTYGGLMVSPLSTGGIQTNGMMWLPLLLIAIERTRHARLATCLACASAAYAMSVLTGHGQSFLYVAILANAYGAFLSFVARRSRRRAWQPLAVSALATLLGASVGAFQILETMRAQRRSIRSSLDYAYFVGGSFTPRAWLWTLAAPLYMDKSVDVTPYVPPLALLLAALAVALYFRKAGRDIAHDAQRDEAHDARHDARRDPRVVFWLAVAIVSALLMLGDATPLSRLLFRVPVINLFRYPCRHALEWTFSIATLAAYGCDAARSWFERRLLASTTQQAQQRARRSGVALTLTAAAALVGLLWWRATGKPPGPGLVNVWYVGLARRAYLVWKLAFVALSLAALWRCASVAGARRRAVLLAVAIAVACFFEPFIAGWHWWHLFAKTRARFSTPAATTRFLVAHEPTLNRAYTRVNLDAEEFTPAPQIDGPNTHALYGVENVAGFEHLILSRYSRALGNVWSDGVNPRPGYPQDDNLLDARSHVLDLLNTSFLVTYPQLSKIPDTMTKRSTPLSNVPALGDLDETRWRIDYDNGDAIVARNLRALPRAWLVTEAEAVDGEEALRRIRGEGGAREFDPRRTVLLEVRPKELPTLPAVSNGAGDSAQGTARVVEYEPNRIVVETDTRTPSVLVVSEIFYPGWEASVDGRTERISLADYLLRAVALPAGRHRVEMRYTAPAARNGAFISVLTMALLLGLGFGGRIRRALRSRVER